MSKIARFIKILCFTFSFFVLSMSCKKNANTADLNIVIKNNIVMEGSQEVPAKITAATGSIDVSYNKTTKVLTYTIRWNGLTGNPTGMHFHSPCLRGSNAAVVVHISGFNAVTSGSISGTVTLDGVTQKEDEFLGGKWYSNIHTATNPGGEIRGQIEF